MNSLVNLAYKKLIPIIIKENNKEVILFVIDTFPWIHIYNDLLLEWCTRYSDYDIAKSLILRSINEKLNFRIKDDIVFKFCARFGYVDLVKILLENGVSFRLDNDYAFRWAIFNDDSEMIQLLKDKGLKVVFE